MRMPPVVARRLRATDVRHFAGDSTFHQVARAVCTADAAIARKELPECWAMAERIHAEFWRSAEPPRRVVDVAAGARAKCAAPGLDDDAEPAPAKIRL